MSYYFSSKTLHCKIKNVKNWFGYQRKLYLKTENTEKLKVLKTRLSHIQNHKLQPDFKKEILEKDTQENQNFIKNFENLQCYPQKMIYLNNSCFNVFTNFSLSYLVLPFRNNAIMNQFF